MNEVAMKKENAVAVNMFEADADKGSQNMTQEDLALPFLKVLGQLSPEVNKRDGKYVHFNKETQIGRGVVATGLLDQVAAEGNAGHGWLREGRKIARSLPF